MLYNFRREDFSRHDDIRIHRSWIETNEKGEVEYLMYELSLKDSSEREWTHLYKAVSLIRLSRLNKKVRELENMLDIWDDNITGFWERGINFITLYAYVRDVGLLFCYGAQGVSQDIDEAREEARLGAAAIRASFSGSFAQSGLKLLTQQEASWIIEKMNSMQHLQILRGIPMTRNAPGAAVSKGLVSGTTNPDAVEQVEELIRGMYALDKEFMFILLSTPVHLYEIQHWLGVISRLAGKVASEVDGSRSASFNLGLSPGIGSNLGASMGISDGYSESLGTSFGESAGVSTSHGGSLGFSEGLGHSAGLSAGASTGVNAGESINSSLSAGQSASQGMGYGMGSGYSDSANRSARWTTDALTNDSFGGGGGHNASESGNLNMGIGTSHGMGIGAGASAGASQGMNLGSSVGLNQSQNMSLGASWGAGTSEGISRGFSEGRGLSMGSSMGRSMGTSHSLGMGAGFGWGQSFRTVDLEKMNLVTILDNNRMRFLMGVREGMFNTAAAILTEDAEGAAAAATLAKAAFWGDIFPSPLQILELAPEVQEHMIRHFSAFSSCTLKEGIPGVAEGHLVDTVLLPREMAAYTHPPRIEMGALSTVAEPIPYFRVAGRMQGEIYLGKQISPETGEKTNFDWKLSKPTFHHTLIAGASGTGKSVTSIRFMSETANNIGFGLTILDFKKDWRALARLVPKDRFVFYSLTPRINPIRLNLVQVPDKVAPEMWRNTLIECLASALSLGQRGYEILWQHLDELYEESGVYDDPEKSRYLTLLDLLERVELRMKEISGPGKGSNDEKGALQRVIERLKYFRARDLRDMYANPEGSIGIDKLCEGNKVVVLEAGDMDSILAGFILGAIAAGIFRYGRAHDGFHAPEKGGGRVVVFEEAHNIIKGAEKGNPLGITESIYERMWNEARSMNLYLAAISQMPSHLPPSLITNSATMLVHRLGDLKDAEAIIFRLLRDPRVDHRDVQRFIARMPTGWCIAQASRGFDYVDAEPILVATEMVKADPPTDEELMALMNRKS